MASVNVSESEFDVLASAAYDAHLRGDKVAAAALDKMARKANAALTNDKYRSARWLGGAASKSLTWEDVPSTLTR